MPEKKRVEPQAIQPSDIFTPSFDPKSFPNPFGPYDVKEFLPYDLATSAILGIFHSMRIVTSCLYATYNSATAVWVVESDNRADPFNLGEGDNTEYRNKLCRAYYKATDGKCPKCMECDTTHMRECVDKNRSEVHKYKCWLGFEENVYPLTVAGKVRATIIAGQLIPDEPRAIETIRRRIQENSPTVALRQRLFDLLPEELSLEQARPSNFKQELHDRLRALQATLQKVANRLYDAHKRYATDEFFRKSSHYLASHMPSTETDWWQHTRPLFDHFCQITGMGHAHVFYRKAARYLPYTSMSPDASDPVILRTKEVVSDVPPDVIVTIGKTSSLYESICETIRRCPAEPPHQWPDQIQLFRYDTSCSNTVLSTLMVLCGTPAADACAFVEEFCRTACVRFSIASLAIRLARSQEAYKLNVGQVAHSFRHPLQNLMLSLDRISQLLGTNMTPEIAETINDSMARLSDAKEDVTYLLASLQDPRSQTDLIRVLREVVSQMLPLARSHPCKIVEIKPWPKEVIVNINERRIRIALTNLVENAVKYSYKGRKENGETHLHDVRIWVTADADMVTIKITNYGIGIPPEFIDILRQGIPGQRAAVYDQRETREGTGWGFATALGIFEEHGGYVEVDSYPPDDSPRSHGEEYHRYVTEVCAVLPLIRRIYAIDVPYVF